MRSLCHTSGFRSCRCLLNVLVIVGGVGCLRLALVDVADVCLKLVAWAGRLKELILLKAKDVFLVAVSLQVDIPFVCVVG